MRGHSLRRYRRLMSVSGAVRAALVATALLLLAACSNRESALNREPYSGRATASPVDGVQQITLRVGADDRFHPSTIVVHPGKVRVVLKHEPSGAPHDFELTKFPHDYVTLTSDGQTHSATFTAPQPGRYQFVCTIHKPQGMVGTMIVKQ